MAKGVVVRNAKDDSDVKVNKKGPGALKKSIKYKAERAEVLRRLNEILGVTDDNQKFYMVDITPDKQEQIMMLKDDVSKYFTSKSNQIYKTDGVERPFFSLIRIIYKESGMKMSRIVKVVTREGKSIRTGCYLFNVD